MVSETHRTNTILDAAERILRSKGLENASLTEVETACRLSSTAVKILYPSEQFLWESVIWRKLHIITLRLSTCRRAIQTIDAENALCNLLDTLIAASRAFQVDDPKLFAVYGKFARCQADVVTRFQRFLAREIEEIIEGGIKSGEFENFRAWYMTWVTVNALAPHYDPRFIRSGAAELDDLAYSRIRSLIVCALAREKGIESSRVARQAIGLSSELNLDSLPCDVLSGLGPSRLSWMTGAHEPVEM